MEIRVNYRIQGKKNQRFNDEFCTYFLYIIHVLIFSKGFTLMNQSINVEYF